MRLACLRSKKCNENRRVWRATAARRLNPDCEHDRLVTHITSNHAAGGSGLRYAVATKARTIVQRKLRGFGNCGLKQAVSVLGRNSVYIQINILVLNLGADYKTDAPAKSVNEIDRTMFSEVSPLPCVTDTVQKLLRVLNGNRWPLNLLLLTVQNNYRRLADAQPQSIRPVGMNYMKEIVHRIHKLNVTKQMIDHGLCSLSVF
jgi:hypothetical protein